jgi:hypothetical protein
MILRSLVTITLSAAMIILAASFLAWADQNKRCPQKVAGPLAVALHLPLPRSQNHRETPCGEFKILGSFRTAGGLRRHRLQNNDLGHHIQQTRRQDLRVTARGKRLYGRHQAPSQPHLDG